MKKILSKVCSMMLVVMVVCMFMNSYALAADVVSVDKSKLTFGWKETGEKTLTITCSKNYTIRCAYLDVKLSKKKLVAGVNKVNVSVLPNKDNKQWKHMIQICDGTKVVKEIPIVHKAAPYTNKKIFTKEFLKRGYAFSEGIGLYAYKVYVNYTEYYYKEDGKVYYIMRDCYYHVDAPDHYPLEVCGPINAIIEGKVNKTLKLISDKHSSLRQGGMFAYGYYVNYDTVIVNQSDANTSKVIISTDLEGALYENSTASISLKLK
ncbi:MAG: hypothetical protein E7270_05710 [Lachnospiraceae bacterium]|nr:hypothetical protein [Lachnospiraceae bacterium]